MFFLTFPVGVTGRASMKITRLGTSNFEIDCQAEKLIELMERFLMVLFHIDILFGLGVKEWSYRTGIYLENYNRGEICPM
jgi:hypothetical protein